VVVVVGSGCLVYGDSAAPAITAAVTV